MRSASGSRRGVDGFRVDVFWHLIKDAAFRDDPLNPDYHEGDPDFRRVRPLYSADQPEVLEIAAEMRRVVEEYPGERLLIGEIYLPVQRLAAYYGPGLSGLHLPFNFKLMWRAMAAGRDHAADPRVRSGPAGRRLAQLGARQPRPAAGREPARARPGAGRHGPAADAARHADRSTTATSSGSRTCRSRPSGNATRSGSTMPGTGQGRDPVRTPMPWDTSANCGFTTGEPWLPLGEGRGQQSVAVQKDAPGSMLALTRALLDLRRREPALATGDFAPLTVEGDVLAYARTAGDRRRLVILNLESRPKTVRIREATGGRVELSTHPERVGAPVAERIELAADEAVVIAPERAQP